MTSLQRILVPTDGSLYSKQALEYALMLAKTFYAKIMLLMVADTGPLHAIPPGLLPAGALATMEQKLLEQAKIEFDRFYAEAADPTFPIDCSIQLGNPVQEILTHARIYRVNLIVMGIHGQHGMLHHALGAVTEQVLRQAPCPILSVQYEEQEFMLFKDHQDLV